MDARGSHITVRRPRADLIMRWANEAIERSHRVAALVVAAVILSLGAVAGIGWTAGPHAVAHRLIHVQWEWIPVLVGCEAAAYLGYLVAYRAVVRAENGAELRLPEAAALVATGFGVFVLAGGFVLDREGLTRAGLTAKEARERVLGLGALEYVVLAPAAAIAAGFALLEDGVSPGLTLPWLIGVPVGTVLAACAVARHAQIAGQGAIRRRLDHAVSALLLIVRMARRPRMHWAAFAGMTLYWLADIACLWAALHVFSAGSPPVAQLLLGYATGYALTRRTLPLGGAGVVEALLPLSLAWVGLALAPALLAVVLYRIANLWLPVIPALAGIPHLRRLGARRHTRGPDLAG
jgi:uncharacterized membrane protein YbhN (UPF0104 family)